MKRFFLLCICGMVIMLASCEKKPFDYRNKFLGDFDISKQSSNWVYGGSVEYDSIETTAVIDIYDSDGMQLCSAEGDTLKFYIDKSGVMSQDASDFHYHFTGSFADRNTFSIQYGYSGLGGGYSTSIEGARY